MTNPKDELNEHLVNSKVKTAILFLTSDRIPNEENFDFVLELVKEYDLKEARNLLSDNYYEEMLEWSEFSEL